MNKKGAGLDVLLLFFIAVVIAAAFIPVIANSSSAMTTTYGNATMGNVQGNAITPAAAGSAVYITGQDLLSVPTVVNGSDTFDCVNNVSFTDDAVNPTTGVKQIKMTSGALYSSVYCGKVNVSYTYGAEGYIDNAGGRGMVSMIVLFSAIALLGVAIYYFWKEGFNF